MFLMLWLTVAINYTKRSITIVYSCEIFGAFLHLLTVLARDTHSGKFIPASAGDCNCGRLRLPLIIGMVIGGLQGRFLFNSLPMLDSLIQVFKYRSLSC